MRKLMFALLLLLASVAPRPAKADQICQMVFWNDWLMDSGYVTPADGQMVCVDTSTIQAAVAAGIMFF